MSAREAASARLDGEASELDAARLEAHLLDCPGCRAYALGIAGVAAELRAAPLERPRAELGMSSLGVPRRRWMPVSAAAAAVALVAAVTGISFAVGSVLGAHAAPSRTAAAHTTDAVLVRQDSTQQHLLAMLNSFAPLPPPGSGRMHAI
jgi:predicted anti-sigma-YlaC factor YlaD